MGRQEISLQDRYDLEKSSVLLNGTQALVRLMLMQKERDRRAGLNTAGYVSGYRGSPLGAVDMQMARAEAILSASDVQFQPGLNEDLSATSLWGTQQAELRGEGTHDGVFGLWYGKGPGVDRSGDAMRHANFAGTSPYGGVLFAMGDDHTGESSTTCHQSDFAAVDAHIPVLSPAGVQEILDFGLYGYALSRYSGLWAGLKLMKDTVEVTSVVNAVIPDAPHIIPDLELPADGLNIRLGDHWVAQEERLVNHKLAAAEAFARANKLDRRVWGKPGAKIGFVAAGKNWLDLTHALGLLNLDAGQAESLGITTYKIGQTWPLDQQSFSEWAEGLDLIVVVEEKRKLIEVQIKEAIFDNRQGRRVFGAKNSDTGEVLFPSHYSLDPAVVAQKIGAVLLAEGRDTGAVRAGLEAINAASLADNAEDIAARLPYFCSGCPHNTSTKVPEGSRAYAGIGCHTMALWMDRETSNYTHMGAEGAAWIGESAFSKHPHMFQNIGDGTYNHSGLMAIRAAVMAGTNITYKILFNDAVALTGGQTHEADLTPDRIVRELLAQGVCHVDVVFDDKEEPKRADFPDNIGWYPRDQLGQVQNKIRLVKGVSAIVYIQTCAAEKRRKRKRNAFPDPDKRVFINTDVCEGCGDCGVQSNCVSIVPVETELGRKRAIDQSSCNKDFSCVNGFCPSYVTIEGAKIKKEATTSVELPHLPEPELPVINGTHNVVITGVGGTGVVTIGAVIAMAAHVDGKGAGMMEMAGLAQKGGAVHIHCRLANAPEDIAAIRVAVGECDAIIGGDLVVSAGAKTIGLMQAGRTKGVINSHEIITGEFTRITEFKLPSDRLKMSLEARLQDGLSMFDATQLSKVLMGDSIYSNMMVFGAAWQMGAIPLTFNAIETALTLNGAAVEQNKRAFAFGRWVALYPNEAIKELSPQIGDSTKTLAEKIDYRATHLVDYQGRGLAKRYRKMVDRFDDPRIREAVALGYHKVLAYKDEYEVARLLQRTAAQARSEFDGDLKLTYNLAPPFLSKTGPDGRPAKREYTERMAKLFPLLARFKLLRGTWFDPFGRTAERKMERALIKQYEADMQILQDVSSDGTQDAAVALAALPLEIRGFGPVKDANARKAAKCREELLSALRMGAGQIAAE